MAFVSFENDPFEGLLSLQSALGRLLENPAPPWSVGPSSRGVFPPMNVFADREGGLVVRAEAPGIDPGALDIKIEPQRLTIGGERAREDADGKGFHRRERRFGRFSRSIQLPADLDPEKATASYTDGMLTIRIQKADAARPRRIEIAR
jgi:HSP20 family protein